MDIYLILIIMHLAGTILGVGGATMIEVILSKSLQDTSISKDERAILSPTYSVVRFGLVLAILSGFGFLLLYKLTGQTVKLYDPVLWAKISIILVIAVNTLLLQAHKISLYWGSALSFVSWWIAALLGVFLTFGTSISFLNIMIGYVLLVAGGALVLHAIRNHHTHKTI